MEAIEKIDKKSLNTFYYDVGFGTNSEKTQNDEINIGAERCCKDHEKKKLPLDIKISKFTDLKFGIPVICPCLGKNSITWLLVVDMLNVLGKSQYLSAFIRLIIFY